ncbi:DUF4132 domain-containing protein [Bacillus sp. NP157]|nr:DUF4132 domain-containing protein [Bacillus sp. NP157]
MLKWIGKVLGGGGASASAVEQENGVWLRALTAWLSARERQPNDPLARDTAAAIAAFVAEGKDPSLLDRLAADGAVGNALGTLRGQFTGMTMGGGPEQATLEAARALYATVDAPAETMLRWARVLEASVIQPSRQRGGQTPFMLDMPDHSHWTELLVAHACGCALNQFSERFASPSALTHDLLDAMAVAAGQPPGTLLVATFSMPVGRWGMHRYRALAVVALGGYADALVRHAERLRPLMSSSDPDQRAHMIGLLDKGDARASEALAGILAEWATAPSRALRSAAQPLAVRAGTAIIEPLLAIARGGKPDNRAFALRLLWMIGEGDEARRDELRELAGADKAASVRALLDEWASGAGSVDMPDAFAVEVPVIDWSCPPGVDARIDRLFAEVNARIDAGNRQRMDYYQKSTAGQKVSWKPWQEPLFAPKQVAALKQAFRQPPVPSEPHDRGGRQGMAQLNLQLNAYATWDGVTPAEIYRIFAFFGSAAGANGTLDHGAQAAFNAMQRHSGRPGLLEIAVMGEAFGAPAEGLLRNIASWSPFATEWPAEAVWPYMARHLHAAADFLRNAPRDANGYWFRRPPLYRALATLPVTPALIVNTLYEVALGTAKADRLLAQDALGNLPDKEIRIIAALSDGKAEVRAVAATWLGRLRHAPAIAPLATAVAREKHDVAKGAMLDALQVLGEPVERFLNRDALASEAAKSLAKGLPKDLDAFPWDAIPAVRWADTGDAVPADVLRWMIAQAVKQKTPEPNAVLRKYCAMFEPRDRERFGQFVLDAWIAEDLRPIDADVAMRRAANSARQTAAFLKQYPQHAQEHRFAGKTEQEIYTAMLPAAMREPRGSAASSKGMLAVAAACAGGNAADSAGRYLKEYYGTRASQGKSLIAMLAWIEHPSAIQLMLSIGSRFRTKSFQEEASRQARALADRNDWTLDELADRTVPTAGFDEEGNLELSYGERVFVARLLAGLQLELRSPDGKVIKSLPNPRQDDDAEQVKASKQSWAAAKKSLKSVVDLQSERLYEALCTEREWRFADWDRYFNRHAVMGQLIRRLAWTEIVDGAVARVFRPLDDGTLTDVDDEAVTLDDEARVRIAHDSLLAADVVDAWSAHFADYEVAPLFQQFGKGSYRLDAANRGATSIKDFEGHLTETFPLRGRMSKLGYVRGPTEDGGWFSTYVKRFPTLNITAHIHFTGNPLPETNRTVAFEALSFTHVPAENAPAAEMSLGQVPAILLSECYNDLRLAAADGPGYDADWKKKSEY